MQNVLSKRSLLGHPPSERLSSGAAARSGIRREREEALCEGVGPLDGPAGKETESSRGRRKGGRSSVYPTTVSRSLPRDPFLSLT